MQTLNAYVRAREADRRIRAAQTILWIACLGPMLVFILTTAVLFIRQPETVSQLDLFSLEAVGDVLWLAGYAVASVLIGRRRAPSATIGAVLGCALFVRAFVLGVQRHRIIAFETGCAVVGIVLIARAFSFFERT